MNIIDKIKSSDLNSSQKSIASFLTRDIHKTVFLSGPEIAKDCNVSISAITRFAQKVGYKGFPELKKELEAFYKNQSTPFDMFESFINKNIKNSVSGMTLSQDIENINHFQSSLDEVTLTKVSKAISKSKTVYLVAIGMSEILVDTLSSYLEAFDINVIKLKSFGVSKKSELINFTKSDLVICFSFQRVLKEVHSVSLIAKKQNATVVAITDSEANPLSLSSDFTLTAPVTGTTFGMSLIAPLALVNIIGNSYAMFDKENNLRKLKKVKKVWEEHPIFCH